jgi:hypothetical protein
VIIITSTVDRDRFDTLAQQTYLRRLNYSRVINREHTTGRQVSYEAVGFLFVLTFLVAIVLVVAKSYVSIYSTKVKCPGSGLALRPQRTPHLCQIAQRGQRTHP